MGSYNIFPFVSGSFYLDYFFKIRSACSMYQNLITSEGRIIFHFMCIHTIFRLSSHPPINGHLGSFSLLAFVNKVTVNIGMYTDLPESLALRYFGHMPRNAIAGSYGISVGQFF